MVPKTFGAIDPRMAPAGFATMLTAFPTLPAMPLARAT